MVSSEGEFRALSPAQGQHRQLQAKKKLAAQQLRDGDRAAIKEVFEMLDIDNSGQMDKREFKVALESLGFQVTQSQVQTLLNDMDLDGSGLIGFEEFESVMTKKMLDRKRHTQMLEKFPLFDSSNTGYISAADLRSLAETLGDTVTDEQLEQMISLADLDGDAKVSAEEFLHVFKSYQLQAV